MHSPSLFTLTLMTLSPRDFSEDTSTTLYYTIYIHNAFSLAFHTMIYIYILLPTITTRSLRIYLPHVTQYS